jgi:hypothetical protein
VLAPTSVEDCFYTAIEAVNIARKYSTPVFILTDQGIATRIEAFEEPNLEKVCQDISPDFTPVAEHKPYDLSKPNGITRHVAPGTKILNGKYPIATGLEHDEMGHPTGSPKLHAQMTAKPGTFPSRRPTVPTKARFCLSAGVPPKGPSKKRSTAPAASAKPSPASPSNISIRCPTASNKSSRASITSSWWN